MQVDLGTTHYSEGAQTAPIFSLDITVCSSQGVEMAQGTRAQDAVLSVPPGQRQVEDANTGSDGSWLAGTLSVLVLPPVKWEGFGSP